MDKVIIVGAGYQAELVFYYMKLYELGKVEAFSVQKKYYNKKKLFGLPVVLYESLPDLYPPGEFKIFIAIGPQDLNHARESLYLDTKEKGYSFYNCICTPPAILSPDLVIGNNVFIGGTAGISPYVKIGNNVTVVDSKIGHHTKIKDNVLISGSTIGGKVTVENNVLIGLSSTISSGVRIGKKSVIGLGSVITNDVDPYSVYSNNTTQKRKIDSRRLKI